MDFDMRGQREMDFINEGSVIMDYGLKHYPGPTRSQVLWILAVTLLNSSDQDQPCCSQWERVFKALTFLCECGEPHLICERFMAGWNFGLQNKWWVLHVSRFQTKDSACGHTEDKV